MTNAPESEAITLADMAVFEAARSAVILLKKTFETWVTIGRAVVRARDIANIRGGGRGGNRIFMRLIEQQGLGKVVDKATASRLEKIMAQLPEVTKWHETLTTREQIDWAAPTTIMKRCPVFNSPKAEKGPKPKPPAKLDHAIDSLRYHLDQMDDDNRTAVIEKIAGKQREEGDLFKPTDTAKDIAAVLVGMFSARKAEQIARDMLKMIKGRAESKAVLSAEAQV